LCWPLVFNTGVEVYIRQSGRFATFFFVEEHTQAVVFEFGPPPQFLENVKPLYESKFPPLLSGIKVTARIKKTVTKMRK
jgi:hypothetical protein